MSKKKNRKMSMLLCICFLFAMIGVVLISGTYAKYTTKLTGTDSATVAKWSWKIGNTTISASQTEFNFNLFDTIKDTDATNDETDVTASKIAPGTTGVLEFTITNESEVTGKVELSFTETNVTSIPIEYSINDGASWIKPTDGKISFEAVDVGIDGSETYKVKWRWVFESGENESDIAANDAADTAIGFAAASSDVKVEISATLSLVQID